MIKRLLVLAAALEALGLVACSGTVEGQYPLTQSTIVEQGAGGTSSDNVNADGLTFRKSVSSGESDNMGSIRGVNGSSSLSDFSDHNTIAKQADVIYSLKNGNLASRTY